MLPSLTLALLLLPAQADTTKAKVDALAPFVGEEVAAILHADLAAIDVERDVKALLGRLADDRGIQEGLPMMAQTLDALRKAGAGDAYVLVDPLELPGIPTIVMPAARDPNALREALAGLLAKAGPPVSVEVLRGAVVAGSPDSLQRLRRPLPARKGLAEALAAAGDAPLAAILLPSDAQRRALEEAVPEIPRELGGGSIAPFSEGLKWAVATVRARPTAEFRMLAQAADAKSAEQMHATINRVLDAIPKQVPPGSAPEALTQMLARFRPDLKGDQLVLQVDAEKAMTLIAEPVNAARQAARRAQGTNNLKQVGLALHNYHDVHGSFPPAYLKTRDGKPGLSWRVAILPFIEQQALYDQFHLDEPWDSAHNKALIEKMPRIYADPQSAVAGEGKTVYLAPRGEATILRGAEGLKIQEITDGTSNTIMVAQGNDESAVIWTKPDDWELGDMPTLDPLTGLYPNGFNALFADGSVKFLKDTLNLDIFRALLTRNGGEVIAFDAFD
jgi:prepilin-type processing-associated H-X9-DG protein